MMVGELDRLLSIANCGPVLGSLVIKERAHYIYVFLY
jgi:hypothetical protein